MAELDEIEIQHLKIHWEHFKLHFELLQKYIETVIKFLTFYILLSAGIISYYLVHSEMPNLRFSLLFPVIIGIISIIFFYYGIKRSKLAIDSIDIIAKTLFLTNIPEYSTLPKLLYLSIFTFILTIVCLLYLFFCGIG